MASILESLTRELSIRKYADWLIFVARLNEVVCSGRVRKVPVLKRVWSDYEEWFLDPETGEIYVYCSPDSPSLPIWERVDVLKHLEETPDPAPLSVFKTGQITVMTAHIMKLNLESLVASGLVETLTPPPGVTMSGRGTEKWFRDNVSNVIYRLREYYGLEDADDIRWEIVPQNELSGKIQ
ncbi:MAG TPA: hypothetical protein VGG46_04715 [Terriglobales bacterium]|jgi:hypothetical protein